MCQYCELTTFGIWICARANEHHAQLKCKYLNIVDFHRWIEKKKLFDYLFLTIICLLVNFHETEFFSSFALQFANKQNTQNKIIYTDSTDTNNVNLFKCRLSRRRGAAAMKTLANQIFNLHIDWWESQISCFWLNNRTVWKWLNKCREECRWLTECHRFAIKFKIELNVFTNDAVIQLWLQIEWAAKREKRISNKICICS